MGSERYNRVRGYEVGVTPTQLSDISRYTYDAAYDAQDTHVRRLEEEIEEMRQGHATNRTEMEAQRQAIEAQREADRAVMEAQRHAIEAQREVDRAAMEAQMQSMREHIEQLTSVIQMYGPLQLSTYIIKYIFFYKIDDTKLNMLYKFIIQPSYIL